MALFGKQTVGGIIPQTDPKILELLKRIVALESEVYELRAKVDKLMEPKPVKKKKDLL